MSCALNQTLASVIYELLAARANVKHSSTDPPTCIPQQPANNFTRGSTSICMYTYVSSQQLLRYRLPSGTMDKLTFRTNVVKIL